MTKQPDLLLGCGILWKEVEYLIRKNHWNIETEFLDSGLHVDFEALAEALQTALDRHSGRKVSVFYGCCHPHMEQILEDANSSRTKGQNCIEMLLGPDKFMEELSNGAFFLLEDWALRWDDAIGKTFGTNPDVVKEIFQLSSKYILAIRTPCSGDFSRKANDVSLKTGLPLRWIDQPLDFLERVIQSNR